HHDVQMRIATLDFANQRDASHRLLGKGGADEQDLVGVLFQRLVDVLHGDGRIGVVVLAALQSVCQQVAAHGQRVRYEDTNLGVGIWKRCQVVNTKTNRVTSGEIVRANAEDTQGVLVLLVEWRENSFTGRTDL